jgi:putative SOS response-associated peptidase YedK
MWQAAVARHNVSSMCNLYSMTKGQQAIREFTRATRDTAGNLPPLPGIFPDGMAPVVFNGDAGERELTMMRWGMPCPPQFGTTAVTNIRNTASPHWRRWLGPASRCLVPATSFCEWEDTKPRKTPIWFALAEDRPLFCFAGIWTTWTGTRGTKADPVTGEHRLFGFLTTEPNAEVRSIHPKAMPVILKTPAEMDAWLMAPWGEVAAMQRPLIDGTLMVVARNIRADG